MFTDASTIIFCLRKHLLRAKFAVMDILEIAIKAEGSPAALAKAFGVDRQNVNNWRKRGMPHMVSRAIKAQYAKQISREIKKAKMAESHANIEQSATKLIAETEPI